MPQTRHRNRRVPVSYSHGFSETRANTGETRRGCPRCRPGLCALGSLRPEEFPDGPLPGGKGVGGVVKARSRLCRSKCPPDFGPRMPRAPRLAYGLAERLLQGHEGAAALSNSAHRVASPVPRDAEAQAPAVTSQPEPYRGRRHVCSFRPSQPLLPTAWRLASRSARREPSRTVGGDFVQANHLRPRTKHPRRRQLGGPPRGSRPFAGGEIRSLEERSAGAGWDDTPTPGRVGCPADREIEGKKFSDPS